MSHMSFRGCFALVLLSASLHVGAAALDRATIAVPEVPVAALKSSFPPKEAIWVRVHIVQQTDDDTYLIQDRTGDITLFLPTERLVLLDLRPGMEVLVYGTVDVSPVNPEKNELYAEKILLPPAVPSRD